MFNTFRWSERKLWHRDVLALASDLITKSVIREFRSNPPECVASDDLEWLNRVVEEMTGQDVSMKEIIMARMQKHYGHIIGFHGCRPASLDSYKIEGMRLGNPAEIQEQARQIFGPSAALEAAFEDLRTGIAYEDSSRGKLYFVLEIEELVEFCGHYLLYGSEYLGCVAERIGKRHLLRAVGKATIIECKIPSDFLAPVYWECLAGAVIADIFETLLDPSYQGDSNFGFPIDSPLPPEAIVKFHFPKNIPNPMNLMRPED